MSKHFNVVVLGAGPGGYVAALKAAQLGASVAVVEKSHLGGTCLNNGCIPSKALLASSELLHHIAQAADYGIALPGQPTFDWTKIQARKDKVIATLRGGIKALLGSRKVTMFQGQAALNGPGKIVIKGEANEEITADKVILAVGSVPSTVPVWPSDRERVCTSDEALHWKQLPKSLLIVGGGVIGCEFACMLQPFGVQVTVVEMLPHLLPNLDSQLAVGMDKALTKRGIKCFAGVKIENLVLTDTGVRATLSNGQTVDADKALVATGRKPNTRDMGLETVGLSVDRGFVRVNDQMETPVKGYYCIGDANGRCLLAHAASAQGMVAAQNATGHDATLTQVVPSCVYTFPEIGCVGLSEDEARAKGLPIAIGNFPLGHLGKAMAAGDTDGFAKVIRNRETGQIVGVHMMGHNVTEVIAAAGALVGVNASVEDMTQIIWSHPSISEGLKEAAEDSMGIALHLPPKRVLHAVAE